MYKNKNIGSTFVEILIAMIILATSLLVIFKIELSSFQRAKKNYMTTVATIELINMFERLRANHTPEKRATESIIWNENIHKSFPNLNGTYRCLSNSCAIFITGKNFSISLQNHV